MFSLKPAFDRAHEGHRGIDSLTLLFWAVSIDNDRQQREKERRLKRQAFTRAPRVPSPRFAGTLND
jgi:hypothetical protein